MSIIKTVWVMDIHHYLIHLEQSLYQLTGRFPWLANTPQVEPNRGWMDTYRFDQEIDQRNQLINWIIQEELYQMYYLNCRPYGNEDFAYIHNALVCEFDLNRHTLQDIFVPKFYGDVYTTKMHRQSCWLYLECEVATQKFKHYALSAISTARPKG